MAFLLLLAPPLLLGALCIAYLGISRSAKQHKGLRHYENPRTVSYDSSQPAKPRQETSVTLGPVATCRSEHDARRMSTEAILQLVLDALHHLTGLPLLMVNQPDHNLPCLTRAETQQMRAEQKNAALLDSPRKTKHSLERPAASWSDNEAPEEEISDLSDSEEEQDENAAEVTPASTAQCQLFDGLQFYLAVSQVRERTVRSVLALGMAKTLTTLRDRKQNQSIALIEQRYPDFTCLPSRNTAVRQLPEAEQPPMDLLAALQLPSAAAVAQNQSSMKTYRSTSEGEGRVRVSSRGPNLSRVA
ncbi:hypothetical protein KRP22_007635 [Phytophthora ramorum]|nr:hypothetical protein KRP22_4353 [Phytophthora ramorum]